MRSTRSSPGGIVRRAGVLHAIVVAACLVTGTLRAGDPRIELYVSSKGGDRLTRRPSPALAPGEHKGHASFTIDEKTRYQTIVGFGASFLEAGMICLNALPDERQDEILQCSSIRSTGQGSRR